MNQSAPDPAGRERARKFFEGSLDDNPRVRFESLPPNLQLYFHTDQNVHVHVTAFMHGKINREQLLEQLADRLAVECNTLRYDLQKFTSWFGAPA